MVYHGLPWFTMVYHDLPWFTMVYHGLPWFTMVYHGLTWFTIYNWVASPGGIAGLMPLLPSGLRILLPGPHPINLRLPGAR